jgi:hypothetical protein
MYYKLIALPEIDMVKKQGPYKNKIALVELALPPKYKLVRDHIYPLLISSSTKVDSETSLKKASPCPVSMSTGGISVEPVIERKIAKGTFADRELFDISRVIGDMVEDNAARTTGVQICQAIDQKYLTPYALDWYIDTVGANQLLLYRNTTADEFRERIYQVWPQRDEWSYEKSFGQGSFLGSNEAKDLIQIAENNDWFIVSQEEIRLAGQMNRQAVMVNFDEQHKQVLGVLIDTANEYLYNALANEPAKAEDSEEFLYLILKNKIKEQHGDYVIFRKKNLALPNRELIYKFFYNEKLYALSLIIEPHNNVQHILSSKKVDAITLKLNLNVLAEEFTCGQEFSRGKADYDALLKFLIEQQPSEQVEEIFVLFRKYFKGFTLKLIELLMKVRS